MCFLDRTKHGNHQVLTCASFLAYCVPCVVWCQLPETPFHKICNTNSGLFWCIVDNIFCIFGLQLYMSVYYMVTLFLSYSTTSKTPLPSARQYPSYGDCLEVKREYYQNCSVLDCVIQCSQSAAHLYEQFLQVQQTGFVTLGPLRCA